MDCLPFNVVTLLFWSFFVGEEDKNLKRDELLLILFILIFSILSLKNIPWHSEYYLCVNKLLIID